MLGSRPASFPSFTCPRCQTLYQVIKAEAGPETVDRAAPCRVCGEPIPGREGNFVLKYFLLHQAGRVRHLFGEGSDTQGCSPISSDTEL